MSGTGGGAGDGAGDGAGSGITVTLERGDADGVDELVAAGDAYHLGLYAPESYHALSLTDLDAATVRLFVARDSTTQLALGMVALVLGPDSFAELKRMFVREDARGRGAASRLVRAAEAYATRTGVRILRLETGRLQPAALGLYASLGYLEIDPFGAYVGDPDSVCFAKAL